MAYSTKQPFEISDFSGGITDNVFGGKLPCAEALSNFVILPDKKLLSRPGSQVDDTAHDKIPAGNVRIGALINYAKNDKLFVQSGAQIFYRSGSGTGAYSTLTGPSSNDVFSAGNTASAVSFAEWNKQLFVTSDAFPTLMKIYKDGSNVYKVRNVGMPALASNPTVTAGASSTHSYVYAFVYTYTYTVFTQTFKEIGAVTEVSLTSAQKPDSSAVSISAIPVITNSGGGNFDTTVIKCEIYRTIDNGTNFYKVGQVTNGTTTFSDTMSDTTLQTQSELYINDGTLDYDAPPSAKFVHFVGNIGLLGYTKDSNGEHPYRVQQSNPESGNHWPQAFTLDVEDEVKGVKSVANLPIVLCLKKVFRIDGLYDSFGRNGMTAVKIHDSAGCISHLSCVEAEGLLYWWGIDGVYASDGYKVFKVSDHLNTTYAAILAAMTQQTRVYGRFDAKNRRIHWACESDSSNLDNDTLLTLDLRWGVSSEMTFYKWAGTSFRPTAVEIFNDYLYRADTRGYVFKHDPDVSTDPKVDTLTDASTWYQETITWLYRSIQNNFGGSFFRKFVSRVLLQAGNVGDTSIQINAINDQGKSTRALKLIRFRKNFVWRSDSFVWRNTECVWRASGLLEQWRRMPARGLRLSYLQVEITNGLAVLANSDTYGTAAIDATGKTATLSGQTWPSQSVDYYLSLETDNYTRLFQVSEIDATETILTLLDSGDNLPVTGSYKWELWGYQKGDSLNLLGYNLHWDNVDQNAGTYQGDDGGNA